MNPLLLLLLGTAAVGTVVAVKKANADAAALNRPMDSLSSVVPSYIVNPGMVSMVPFAATPPNVASVTAPSNTPMLDISGYLQRAMDRLRQSTSKQMIDNNTLTFFQANPEIGGAMSWWGNPSGGAGIAAAIRAQSNSFPVNNALIASNPLALENNPTLPPYIPADTAGDLAGYIPPFIETGDGKGGQEGNPGAGSPADAAPTTDFSGSGRNAPGTQPADTQATAVNDAFNQSFSNIQSQTYSNPQAQIDAALGISNSKWGATVTTYGGVGTNTTGSYGSIDAWGGLNDPNPSGQVGVQGSQGSTAAFGGQEAGGIGGGGHGGAAQGGNTGDAAPGGSADPGPGGW